MLVDTDVLIWHLRDYPNATRRLDELGTLTLSAISWLELLQGMRHRVQCDVGGGGGGGGGGGSGSGGQDVALCFTVGARQA
jgi:hypothetical protein